MAKKDLNFTTVVRIFFSGIEAYFMNFEKFMKYMAFPVLGQIVGLVLIFTAAYLFTNFVPNLTEANPLFDNILFVFILLLLLTLPGFFIFCKAFWDYLVAMAALNSMASYIIESKNKIEDTSVADTMIRKRSFSYIVFLFSLSIIYAFGSFPLLWVILAIGFVYLSLAFQAFALNEDKTAFDAIGLSVNLVKHHFWITLFLLVLLGVSTYWIVPSLISWGFEAGNLSGILSYPVERFITLLPINDLNEMFKSSNIPYSLDSVEISKEIVLGTVAYIVTCFTLPLRSICCTMLYKEIYSKNYAGKIAAEKVVKRAEKKVPDKE